MRHPPSEAEGEVMEIREIQFDSLVLGFVDGEVFGIEATYVLEQIVAVFNGWA